MSCYRGICFVVVLTPHSFGALNEEAQDYFSMRMYDPKHANDGSKFLLEFVKEVWDKDCKQDDVVLIIPWWFG